MIMEKELKLKRNIMRRVYLAYVVKTIFSQKVVKFIPFALVVVELTPFLPLVSLQHVIANMPALTDLKALYSYEVSAFMNTELVVQVSVVATICVLAVYAYKMISNLIPHTLSLRGEMAS